MIRIAMFSGPRNISTTLLRSFENRADTRVFDEPFYAAYLRRSGADHPMREEILRAHESDPVRVARMLAREGAAAISFEKHISFHFPPASDFSWLEGARAFHLIRNPRAMAASYVRKLNDVRPIADSYARQRELDAARGPFPVIDAEDVCRDPEAMLRALCRALGVAFDNAMMSWPAGARVSDGAWAPHWYDAVRASTGFKPLRPAPQALAPALEDAASACMADYEALHKRRLTG